MNKRKLASLAFALCVVLATLVSSAGCTEDKAKAAGPLELPTKPEAFNAKAPTSHELPPEVSKVDAKPAEEPLGETTAERPVKATVKANAVYEASLFEHEGVILRRLKTSSEIENREPANETSTFAPGTGRIYAFMDVRNDTEQEEVLTVNFIGPEGQVRGGIDVRIPPNVPRWRTWAYSRQIQTKGTWEIEVRSSEGALLGTLEFDVE